MLLSHAGSTAVASAQFASGRQKTALAGRLGAHPEMLGRLANNIMFAVPPLSLIQRVSFFCLSRCTKYEPARGWHMTATHTVLRNAVRVPAGKQV